MAFLLPFPLTDGKALANTGEASRDTGRRKGTDAKGLAGRGEASLEMVASKAGALAGRTKEDEGRGLAGGREATCVGREGGVDASSAVILSGTYCPVATSPNFIKTVFFTHTPKTYPYHLDQSPIGPPYHGEGLVSPALRQTTKYLLGAGIYERIY